MINTLLFHSLTPMMLPSMKNQVSKLTIAKNLTDLRKISGLTQAQLAEKLGYTDKAISKWEHAETLPDVITLATIADFYGVTLDYLTTTDEIRKKQQPTNKSQALNNPYGGNGDLDRFGRRLHRSLHGFPPTHLDRLCLAGSTILFARLYLFDLLGHKKVSHDH